MQDESLEFRTVQCVKCGDPDRLIVHTVRGTVSSCYSCGDEVEVREIVSLTSPPVMAAAPLTLPRR